MVDPEKVFAAERVVVADPFWVNVPEPESVPLRVWFAELLKMSEPLSVMFAA